MRTSIICFVICIVFSSCKKCYDKYCIGDLPFYFDITDNNGNPLDNNIPLDSIPIQMYYIENGEEQALNLQKKQTSDGLDTMYMSNYTVAHSRYFIKYQDEAADTLDLQYEKNETDCCGNEHSVISVLVNGQPAAKTKGVYQLQIQ